jgi:endonuclease/exonuclease/phosphatase family metal-dependent hydrolase
MKKTHILFALLVISRILFAGDTIRVMQYNLLYYDKNTGWCNSTNNNVDSKDGYLRDITGSYKPDVFTVNEINGSPTSVQRLLDNVLNVNGQNFYKRANYTGSYLVNMLYYNSLKLALKSQLYIMTSPRITDVYQLYYKSNDLATGDTIFLTCIVTHLKAGNTSSDQQERAVAAQQIMSFVENQNLRGNILLMGDFNVYYASETAFHAFITETSSGVRFYDPVNAIGSWQNNPSYASYHTQSTHINDDNTCASGGGMDDRFDFILTTKSIIDGSLNLRYVEDTYWAYGQDGNRFNQSLISPPNYSLPSNIINSLYNMSDHLPVVLKLFVDTELSSNIKHYTSSLYKVNNPFSETISIWKKGQVSEKVTIQIMNILGGIVYEDTLMLYPGERHNIPAKNLKSGIYLLVINGINTKEVKRIVKQ